MDQIEGYLARQNRARNVAQITSNLSSGLANGQFDDTPMWVNTVRFNPNVNNLGLSPNDGANPGQDVRTPLPGEGPRVGDSLHQTGGENLRQDVRTPLPEGRPRGSEGRGRPPPRQVAVPAAGADQPNYAGLP